MFRYFLILSFFSFSLISLAKEIPIKKKLLKKSSLSYENELSLMDLLNDTDRLKNEIKRDLAKKKKKTKRTVSSKKKVVQFGTMKVSISERKEEDLKPINSSKKNESSKKPDQKTKI